MDQIIYHNACPDGWTAAYIAKMRYPEATLVPRDHGTEIDVESYRGLDIICVDCNLRGKNDEVAAVAKSYHVYDHHKSETEIIGKPYVTFDIDRSGAGIAWDYLFGKDSDGEWTRDREEREGGVDSGEPRPWWVNYVEDRDLWRFKLPNSRAVNQYIMTFPYTIEDWTKMTKVPMLYAAQAGESIQLQIDKYVREAVRQAQHGHLNMNNKTYSVAVVNVPYLNTSEVGEALAYGSDIGLGWFERSDGLIQFSLRSRGDVDVSEIAKQFKGGGHTHAAGFQLSVIQGRNLIDTILGRGLIAYRFRSELMLDKDSKE